ncbi:RluA family pseudouridine synthase [Candidatus Saccharibacteria bacterium TM7i]|nr:RluA family pseudouridine synthase [Candidatus Saccharibacteria bacterium TM7i]
MATRNPRREALKILKDFKIAPSSATTPTLSRFEETEPRGVTRIASVVFEATRYIIVTDESIEDDAHTLRELIDASYPGLKGEILKNPHEDSFETYGLRHKFRDVYVFKVQPQSVRLDKELSARFPDLTRATIQKYIKAGYVHVNGAVVTKPSADVNDAAEITLQTPEKADFSDKELPILYMDDAVIVVHKPAGILTHSKGVMNDEFTVADFFRRYTSFGLETNRPGIVHRLDRDTSGVIIGARTEEAAQLLKKQFANRTVKKTYLAVVSGQPKIAEAVIDLPIGRNPSAPSTFRVDVKGKSALTTYKTLDTNGTHSLVELRPKTGRTHQLRVHMQYIGTPILGDKVYGTNAPADRLYLHAETLELTIPGSERRTFAAAAPDSFKNRLKG